MNSAYIIYTHVFYFNKKNTRKNKLIKTRTKIRRIDNIMKELNELYYSNNWNFILINLLLTLK